MVDGQGDSYIPLQTLFAGGIMKNWREKGHMIRSNEKDNFKQAGR
jgi:hypothetical protein